MNDQPYDPKRLYRSDDSIVCGVCGGIAEYFDLPPFGVRLIWVLLSLMMVSLPLMLLTYIIMAIVLKRRPRRFVPRSRRSLFRFRPPFAHRNAGPPATALRSARQTPPAHGIRRHPPRFRPGGKIPGAVNKE